MSDSESTFRAELIAALIQSDDMRRSDRADRIMWLAKQQIPPSGVIAGPIDTITVLGEARDCFTNGHYVATQLLSLAFIEHIIVDALIEGGYEKTGTKIQLRDAIKCAGKHALFAQDILHRADCLRELRNPFTHRRAEDDPRTFGNRYLAEEKHPTVILEQDAKGAITLAYAFLRTATARL